MVYCFSLEHVKGLLSDRPTIGNDILIQLLKQKSVFREFLVSFEVKLSFEICFRCPYRYLLLATISSLHSDVTWRVYRWIYRACLWLVDSVECTLGIKRGSTDFKGANSDTLLIYAIIESDLLARWEMVSGLDQIEIRSQVHTAHMHSNTFHSNYRTFQRFNFGPFSSYQLWTYSRSFFDLQKILTSRTDLFKWIQQKETNWRRGA